MTTILDSIVETKRKEVAAARRAMPVERLIAESREIEPPRDFHAALATPAPQGVHLIAEVKKASPSAGVIRRDFDPVAIATTYYQCGASAISVLTDQTYFQGRIEYINAIKAAVPLPVLRKDFVVDEYQVHEARRHGADAVLLIAEVLGAREVARLAEIVNGLHMTALIEVHDADLLSDLTDAVDFGSPERRLLGINNRDLSVQRTDITTTARLAAALTDKPLLVSESGIKTRADVEQAARAGAKAILVGETLLRAGDMAAKIQELLGSVPRA